MGPLGVVNDNTFTGAISHSFYDSETTGQSDTGKGEPKATAEMQTLATFTSAGWDFSGESANGVDDIWAIVQGQS